MKLLWAYRILAIISFMGVIYQPTPLGQTACAMVGLLSCYQAAKQRED
jgi:hypothetical protein